MQTGISGAIFKSIISNDEYSFLIMIIYKKKVIFTMKFKVFLKKSFLIIRF